MSKFSLLSWIKGKFHASARIGAAMTAVFIAAVVALNVVIYGLATQFGWYFYTGEHYEHTIGHATDAYLSEVADRGEVRILFCNSADALEADTVYNLVWQTAKQYAERYSFLKIENINIYTSPERVKPYKYQREADGSYTVDPEEGGLVKINDISTSSVIFVSDTDFAVLTMESFFVLDTNKIITAYSGEEVTAAMIRRVLTTERPIAYFTTKHGETYSAAFNRRLLFAGYNAQEIDLWRETPEVGDGNILVISNPRYDLDRGDASAGVRGELDRMEEFLSAGGSVYVMLDPLLTGTTELEKFLGDWGITPRRTEEGGKRDAVTVRDSANAVTTDGYGLVTSFGENELAGEISREMEAAGAGRVIVREAMPLDLTEKEGKTVSSLLTASPTATAHANGKTVDTAGGYTVAAVSRDDATGGGVFAVGSVFLTAQDAITTNEYGNKDLIFLVFRHLSGAAVPVGTTYLLFSSGTLEGLTMRAARWWTALIAGIVPVAVGVTGFVLVRRRRNR